MSNYTELLIIGTEAFGLSMANYAHHNGINYTVVGKLNRMQNNPLSQLVKSTVPSGLNIENNEVVKLEQNADNEAKFKAVLLDGSTVYADRVLVAVGNRYFKHIPENLKKMLPAGSYTHTADIAYHSDFIGKKCLVIGSSIETYETATMLNEAGVYSVHTWPDTHVIGCRKTADGKYIVHLDNMLHMTVDHIILATGYKTDINKLPFLQSGNLMEDLIIEDGYPVLDKTYQTNIYGLFMTNTLATRDFGAFFGFTVGSNYTTKIIGDAMRGYSKAS